MHFCRVRLVCSFFMCCLFWVRHRTMCIYCYSRYKILIVVVAAVVRCRIVCIWRRCCRPFFLVLLFSLLFSIKKKKELPFDFAQLRSNPRNILPSVRVSVSYDLLLIWGYSPPITPITPISAHHVQSNALQSIDLPKYHTAVVIVYPQVLFCVLTCFLGGRWLVYPFRPVFVFLCFWWWWWCKMPHTKELHRDGVHAKVLTEDTFDEWLKEADLTLVAFHAPWWGRHSSVVVV